MNDEKDIGETKDEQVTVPPKVDAKSEKEKKERTNEDYFRSGMLLLVGIIIALSTLQLYFSVDNIITTWFEYQYRPIFRSVYYLFVIGIGLFILKRYLLVKEKK
ncbi:hypothetical protein [Methanolobus profundi]|uniref:DUF8060 domain-containing protein n=1 Tax=Methanolobus profundi TaxID=487685 RepID=A0A1I4SYE7_9EURY|nr:hypothetical protein [Methanolobus profundi]SFM69343.1 hypothetical protein SAMN04488696_2076 [Methanolobus profundi]